MQNAGGRQAFQATTDVGISPATSHRGVAGINTPSTPSSEGGLSPAFRKKQTMSDGKPSIIQRFRLKAALVYSRNVILCFLLALMCGVSVFACGRSRDLYVNESMRRSELVRLGVDRQREVFRQCSPEVKADLYRFKIKSDLKEDKNQTREDRKLLKEVYRHLRP